MVKKILFIFFIFCQTCLSQVENLFPKLIGDYLGQTPPSINSEIFAPGIVSRLGFDDYGITFDTNQKYMFFTCDTIGSKKHNIFISIQTDDGWTVPQPTTLSTIYSIAEPIFSPDSKRIYYSQLLADSKNEMSPHIMVAQLNNIGLKNPVKTIPGLFASITKDSIMYVTDVLGGDYPMEKADIVRYSLKDGNCIKEFISDSLINTKYLEFHPFVSPNEDILIFDSNRPGGFGDFDIYYCTKDASNNWSTPINMGSKVNTHGYEGVATLSPDDKYLFYCNNHDIRWIPLRSIIK